MKDVRSQLNKMLCFDISWSIQEQMMPEVTMPTWELDTQPVIDSVHTLHWKHTGMTGLDLCHRIKKQQHSFTLYTVLEKG